MRVIAGEAGGIPLTVPKSLTRPTADRVREAVFSSLGARVPGAEVLDLYAGTGALGIEALSRGANSVIFVDSASQACETIEANLKKTRLTGGTVRRAEVSGFFSGLGKSAQFDLIFADPPYARDDESAQELGELLAAENLPSALRENGLFVLESLADSELPDSNQWAIERERTYGDTRISFLTRQGKVGE